MSLLPIFLDLKNKPVLIIGGGLAAFEKLEKILETGARVRVLARSYHPDTLALIKAHGLPWENRDVAQSDIAGQFFVISAVNDAAEHARIAAIASRCHVLINTVDAPESTDCFFAAQVSRGPLQIAISSSGLFPGVARSFRLWLEDWLPQDLTADFEDLVQLRTAIKAKIPNPRERMQALKQQLSLWNQQYTRQEHRS